MPSEVALIPITETLKAMMAAHAALTSLIGTKPTGAGGGPAIYDEGAVPQNTPPPYVTIGAGTQVPFHRMGAPDSAKWGWNCTVQIKAVRQGIGQADEAAAQLILSRVVGLFYEGRTIAVTGYGTAQCGDFTIQPTIVTTVAGITTREVPGILRVWVHD